MITVVDGDDIAFRRVENAEEFSQSRVGQIAQDGKGFMWFGRRCPSSEHDSGWIYQLSDAGTIEDLAGGFNMPKTIARQCGHR